MKIDGKHITAEENKDLRRIRNQEVVGHEYWLGKLYYLDGVLLDEPIEEVAEDFEEVTAYSYLLGIEQEKKVAEINAYEVNKTFTINGHNMWYDDDMRKSLIRRFEAEKSLGSETTTLWSSSLKITMGVDDAIKLMNQLEVYSAQCYDTIATHKANVMALTTIEEVQEYDITSGYPAIVEVSVEPYNIVDVAIDITTKPTDEEVVEDAISDVISSEYDKNHSYISGEYSLFGGKLYKVKDSVEMVSGIEPTNTLYWQLCSLSEEIVSINNKLNELN